MGPCSRIVLRLALGGLALAACQASDSAPADGGIPDASIIFPGPDAPPRQPDARVFDAPRPADAGIDARLADAGPGIDARVGDHFDVAYAQEIRINNGTSNFLAHQIALIVNTGTTTIDLGQKPPTVASIMDENGEFVFQIDLPDTTSFAPQTAHGDIADVFAEAQIQALVPEPITNGTVPVFAMGMKMHKGGTYDLHPKVKLQIGNEVAELDFLVHVGSGPAGLSFVKAKRVQSQTMP